MVQRTKSVTVALIQMRASNHVALNMEKVVAGIGEAAERGAEVICLQELFRSRYFPSNRKKDVGDLAETIPGHSTAIFSELARRLEVVIIAPVFEVDGGKYYNSACVIDADGTVLGTYRKVHIPHDPYFYEQSYFDAGNLGYRVFRTRHLSFGVLICYDQWIPEPARILALQGAEVIFYPTAIGHLEGDPLSFEDWFSGWQTVQRSHAIANSVHVAAVNRVGTEGKIKFWGSSFLCDAFGRILKGASAEEEEVLVATLDIDQNQRIREGWGFIKNRRPDTYGLLASTPTGETPCQLGYSMPAEWKKHEATWLAWPYDPVSFPRRVRKVEESYVQMIAALHLGEHVNLLVKDLDMKDRVKRLLEERDVDLRRITFHVWDYADVWFRDYGPIFLLDSSRRRLSTVHWTFNAWGNKYRDLLKDNDISGFINQRLGLTCFEPGIVLEGGAVDVNGKGSLLTTEQCLLRDNRNPDLSKREIADYLENYFGASHLIWLRGGVAGDDTDGHVDNIARFVNPSTVLCACEEDEDDENHSVLLQNYEILLGSKDQDGEKLNIVRVPMPSPIRRYVRGASRRLPASYLNFYIANNVVLVPTFRHEKDEEALKIIQDVFPEREVVGIDCVDLLYGLGTIHCVTQQQPAVRVGCP